MLSTSSLAMLPLPQVNSVPVLKLDFAPEGPCPSSLMIVGEAPSEPDCQRRLPFQGPGGYLLTKVLEEAGLLRGQAFLTNVGRSRPPGLDASAWIAEKVKDRTPSHALISGKWAAAPLRMGRELLRAEILACRPTVVVALGNVALWALTGLWGIRKWRSSVLQGEIDGFKFKVIPGIHPAAILREWPLRGLLVHDLRRAKRELGRGGVVIPPEYRFIIRPTYAQACSTLGGILRRLNEGPVRLSGDIETRGGHTACIGFAWSRREAICIPWMCVERTEGYWALDEEVHLIALCNSITTHPNADITWQNGAYDHQYEHRWHWVQPNLGWDTMLAHHAMFSISPKALDHLSSLYCENHRYWKDDGRNWDPTSMPEEQYWEYNCEDCARTFEIREVEEEAIAALTSSWPQLPAVVAFQHAIQPAIVRMMLRGVRSDDTARAKMATSLMTRSAEIQHELDTIVGQPLNIRSSIQMPDLFYGQLNQTPIYRRNPDGTRGTPTCDDDALGKIAAREPLLRPVIARIQALRSAGVFLSTFVRMPRDTDGRLRCSYNVAGTKTYRLASSENAFGSGGNLQNVPSGDDAEDQIIPLPNIRELFLFDHGKTGFDLDGDSADLRIVTGESGCRAMQAYFAAGAKPYVEIAREFYRDPTITKHHPSYKKMKALCHGSNYGGEAAGLSERIGLPVNDIERMQKWYFGMCPEIATWQDDIRNQGQNRGYIENPFGYRLYTWDRWSRKVANEFLAWTPQSTVGLWINRILLAIDQTLPEVELLLQVHDSLVGQYDAHMAAPAQRRVVEVASSVDIPCRHELVRVPVGLKTSTTSWGACA